MEPVQVCSKLKRSDIAAETLETLPGMNDINTQIQIRSIISAPVLHPTQLHLLPFLPFQMVIGRGCLGGKLITIEDLHNEVTELATNLVNGGSIGHFMLPQGILHQVDN